MKSPLLNIADGVAIPRDFAAARVVCLGKSKAGKTNASCVIVEELVAIGVTVVVLDVLGNMRGLRSAGTGPGLPIAIVVGGDHGDVALDPARAGDLAALVADGLSVVVDLSNLPVDEKRAFATVFLPALTRAVKARGNVRDLHVIVEEAETFTPQTSTSKAHAAARAAMSDFARTAQNFTIGWTMSTQRPQLLAKDVIDTASVLIAMRMTGELAQAAIGNEVKSRHGAALRDRVVEDLPRLARGEAWFLADDDELGEGTTPAPARVQMRFRRTADIARRPATGAPRTRAEATLTEDDLATLRAALAPAASASVTAVHPPPSRRSSADDAESARKDAELAAARSAIATLTRERDDARTAASTALDALRRLRDMAAGALDAPKALVVPEQAPPPSAAHVGRSEPATSDRVRRVKENAPAGTAAADGGDGDPGSGKKRILVALARCGRTLGKRALATVADVNMRNGTLGKYLRELAADGYLTLDRSNVSLVLSMGNDAAGPLAHFAPPDAAELVALYTPNLAAGELRLLRLLVNAHPSPMDKAVLADRADVNMRNGTLGKYLRRLRAFGLADEVSRQTVRASSTLFLAEHGTPTTGAIAREGASR